MITPLIVATALFMEQLDGTILATALPVMAADLHEDPVALKLALTSYFLSLAVFIPLSGWVADKFGARHVFRSAIVVFTLGSILCGFSNSLLTIIIARSIQGMGGAMMTPVGRLVLVRTAPRHELVRAMAWLAMPALIGPIVGPPLGGFLATYFDWRYIFWINAPIGLLGVILSSFFIPQIKELDVRPLDIKGAILSALGLSCLVFGFTIAGRGFAPPLIDALIILTGFFACCAYIRHAHETPHPILDLKLLATPTFHAAIYGGFLFRIGVGATPFLIPLLLQKGFNLSASQSGMITFVGAIGAMVMKTTAQPILNRFGFRRVLIFNALLSSIFILASAFYTSTTPHLLIMLIILIGGFFRSLEFTSLNALAFADITQKDMSNATSFTAVGQQLSLATGVAISAAVLEIMRASQSSGNLSVEDFAPAFSIVALISACSAFVFWRLQHDAGDTLITRRK